MLCDCGHGNKFALTKVDNQSSAFTFKPNSIGLC